MTTVKTIQCQFKGVRPLMFDRYSGDNGTQLAPQDKMYLTPDGYLTIPAINLYSLLCSELNPSVCNKFFGKQGKSIALGIKSYTTIDPYDIEIHDDTGQIQFTGWNEQIGVHRATARVKKSGGLVVPQAKERPLIALPWHIDFSVTYQDNKHCSLENLRQAFEMGGILGIGTFRPYFGRYEVTKWSE